MEVVLPSLAAYYAVTPFDGISAKLTSPPSYTVGSYSHKMLPLLGYELINNSGKPGVTMSVYNEPPSDPNRVKVDSLDLLKTEIHLVDYANEKIKSNVWYADFEGDFVADWDGKWGLSLVVSGTAKLFVNGQLVIDNETEQQPGDAFFGTATAEEKGFLDVKKGGNTTSRLSSAAAQPASFLVSSLVVAPSASEAVA